MRYLITCILITVASVAFSQNINLDSPQVRTATVEFNGGKYNGYQIDFNASPEIVENAIKENFKKQGAKAKETKGFMVYRNVTMSAIDGSKAMDAFIKVERKSRKEKEQTVVYFIPAIPGEISDEKLKADAAAKALGVSAVTNGGAFLTGLVPDVKTGVYNKEVANQQSLVKKEEKKLANLADDQADMEKKLKKLQSDLEFNKKAQERQTLEVEKAKASLADLLTKNPNG